MKLIDLNGKSPQEKESASDETVIQSPDPNAKYEKIEHKGEHLVSAVI